MDDVGLYERITLGLDGRDLAQDEVEPLKLPDDLGLQPRPKWSSITRPETGKTRGSPYASARIRRSPGRRGAL